MRRPRLETQPRASHALVSNPVRHGPTPDLSVFRGAEAGPVAESFALTTIPFLTSTSRCSSPSGVTGASLRTLFRLRLDDRLARQTGFHLRHVGSPKCLGKYEAFLQMLG